MVYRNGDNPIHDEQGCNDERNNGTENEGNGNDEDGLADLEYFLSVVF